MLRSITKKTRRRSQRSHVDHQKISRKLQNLASASPKIVLVSQTSWASAFSDNVENSFRDLHRPANSALQQVLRLIINSVIESTSAQHNLKELLPSMVMMATCLSVRDQWRTRIQSNLVHGQSNMDHSMQKSMECRYFARITPKQFLLLIMENMILTRDKISTKLDSRWISWMKRMTEVHKFTLEISKQVRHSLNKESLNNGLIASTWFNQMISLSPSLLKARSHSVQLAPLSTSKASTTASISTWTTSLFAMQKLAVLIAFLTTRLPTRETLVKRLRLSDLITLAFKLLFQSIKLTGELKADTWHTWWIND